MKILFLLMITQWFLFSCTPAQERIDQNQESNNIPLSHSDSISDTLSELTLEQQTAFDALNSIQVHGHHLYSTFPGMHHNCFPPDTSFVISRAELRIAMELLLTKHYSNISAEHRKKLADESVLAQEEYLVLQCGYAKESVDNVVNINPPSGSWILPKVLGRRDIILEW